MKPTRGILILGAALLGVIFVWGRLVDRVIFHPSPGADLRPAQIGLQGEDVFLETEDGVRIHGFWLPAEGADRALLFFHGNAGNASHRLPNAAALVGLGAHVLLLDYRGYGLSEGRPSEAGVYADARAGLAHLVETRGIEEGRIVVFGRSLGGAVAVDLLSVLKEEVEEHQRHDEGRQQQVQNAREHEAAAQTRDVLRALETML